MPRDLAFKYDVLPLAVRNDGLDEVLVLACPDPERYAHVHRDADGNRLPLSRSDTCGDSSVHAMHVALRTASRCDRLEFEPLPSAVLRSHLQRSYAPARVPDPSPRKEFVHEMVTAAVLDHAHDIRIEPLDPRRGPAGRIRFKVLGVAYTWKTIEKAEDLNSIIAVLKSFADGMDNAKSRIQQDGRWQFDLPHRQVALRVVTTPTRRNEGETLTARVLDLNLKPPTPEALGMRPAIAAKFRAALRMRGLLAIAGQPGAGKSTSAESGVNERNDESTFIVAWADPIEIPQYGVTQVESDEANGLTQESILRGMTRHAPDFGNGGEMRDETSARLVFELSDLVPFVGTVHADEALDVFHVLTHRLRVERAAVERSLHTIVGQHLVRRLCGECKTLVSPPAEFRALLAELARRAATPALRSAASRRAGEVGQIYAPVGCAFCMNGYVRRFGVFEILPVTKGLRRIFGAHGSQAELEEEAAREGFEPMLVDAVDRVIEGETSMEELRRVPGYDEALREATMLEAIA